ncbi:hypothetical protein AIOL_001865 [Candidatus Rhodobacter oscarellae]|uniref:Uncharacterized protein n=1 Tax=Candidatus Rhodobacter oscarellae TaxID=1675527 RepID=A0A0J9GTR0_9RHOB|nr:hypothetical protein AIOL_001865 [Candidatus Rhodobacter lobularis]
MFQPLCAETKDPNVLPIVETLSDREALPKVEYSVNNHIQDLYDWWRILVQKENQAEIFEAVENGVPDVDDEIDLEFQPTLETLLISRYLNVGAEDFGHSLNFTIGMQEVPENRKNPFDVQYYGCGTPSYIRERCV